MIQIQDLFENRKPDIVVHTVKGFNIKRTPFIILISDKSLKLGMVVLVSRSMLNVGYNFYYRVLLTIWAGILKTQSFHLCPTLSVRNGPSVRFGTNVP